MPNFIGFALFTLFPVVLPLAMAFTNWTLKPSVPREFVGLRNFEDALGFSAPGEGNPLVIAATATNIVPLIVIFVMLQRFLVKGLPSEGIKA